MSFGGGGTPKVSKPAPIDNSAELEAAARLEAERLRKKKGMKSTWLTQGEELGVANTGKAELMGG